jgi:hypothetical protein
VPKKQKSIFNLHEINYRRNTGFDSDSCILATKLSRLFRSFTELDFAF